MWSADSVHGRSGLNEGWIQGCLLRTYQRCKGIITQVSQRQEGRDLEEGNRKNKTEEQS